jgi:hypothetical protein
MEVKFEPWESEEPILFGSYNLPPFLDFYWKDRDKINNFDNIFNFFH